MTDLIRYERVDQTRQETARVIKTEAVSGMVFIRVVRGLFRVVGSWMYIPFIGRKKRVLRPFSAMDPFIKRLAAMRPE